MEIQQRQHNQLEADKHLVAEWMKLNEEQQNAVISRATARGQATNRLAVSRMLLESEPLYLKQTEFEDDIFFDICRVVFGINPESVEDDNLRRAIFHAICERFIGITINDIQEAFSRHEPSEKVYVLSRKDFLEPIEKYFNKKNIVKSELKKQLEELNEATQHEQKKEAHKKESIELYLEGVRTDGIWKGEFYHASTFAEEQFKDRFSDEEKKKIYHEAWYKVKELTAQQNLASQEGNPFNTPVPTNYQMYCQYLTTKACQKRMPIIIE